jgi:hypothetical protein
LVENQVNFLSFWNFDYFCCKGIAEADSSTGSAPPPEAHDSSRSAFVDPVRGWRIVMFETHALLVNRAREGRALVLAFSTISRQALATSSA